MKTINAETSTLLLIDFQARLMPAMSGGDATVKNARRLVDAAGLIGVPYFYTEQNPAGLGGTVEELVPGEKTVVEKMCFDACQDPALLPKVPDSHALIVTGWEAHVCVLQTALGLLEKGHKVFVVSDATGSRTEQNKEAGLRRMQAHGAEIVTTEMVVFEWLGSAEHPRFREVVALIK